MEVAGLFIGDVSKQTRIPESTLRYWRQTGRGPKSARIGRRVMYRQADVDSWLAAQYDADTSATGAA